MQAAFHDPVTPLQGQEALGLDFLQAQTAEQVDDFRTPLALAADPGLQSGGKPSSREADLSGGDFQTRYGTNLPPPPVLLPPRCVGARVRLRGKKAEK